MALYYEDKKTISFPQREQTIEHGEKIAEYPDDRPYKSYLYLHFIEGKPLHVCFAPVNATTCKVITAYEPSLLIFGTDYKTKRKK